MNNLSSRWLLRSATAILVVAGLAFLVWHFAIRDRRGEREFTPFSFNWGHSGQENVIPGFDQGSVEILSVGDKVAFAICTDFKGAGSDPRQGRNDGVLEEGEGPSHRRVKWRAKSPDGKTGTLVINEETYDLSKGTLFLASTEGGQTRVTQLDKDLTFVSAKPPFDKVFDSVTAFLRSDPEASQSFKAAPIPSTRIYFITIGLPRGEKKPDGKWSPTHDEIYKAVKELPCFARGYYDLNTKSFMAANHNSVDYGSHRDFSFWFAPTAGSDLGDVAKALAKLGGDKNKPVATVNMASNTPIAGDGVRQSEEKFAILKKELAEAKGIDWTNSDRLRFTLDEAGGAKFNEIRAAYKKAGVELVNFLER
jgi:hypothetical protein